MNGGDKVELLDGWEQRESRSQPGMVYYVHMQSGQTQLEAPVKKRRIVNTRQAPPLRPSGVFPGGGGSSGSTGGNASDLFAGLPEAASDECQPKSAQKIVEKEKPVTQVRVLHLLKKHTGSRRPSSWREKVIKRSYEEAAFMLKDLRKKLENCKSDKERKETFEKLALKESDCSSAHEGGNLGRFGKGKMQPAFEQAAFGLKVNELSGLVSTDSGLHLILRLE